MTKKVLSNIRLTDLLTKKQISSYPLIQNKDGTKERYLSLFVAIASGDWNWGSRDDEGLIIPVEVLDKFYKEHKQIGLPIYDHHNEVAGVPDTRGKVIGKVIASRLFTIDDSKYVVVAVHSTISLKEYHSMSIECEVDVDPKDPKILTRIGTPFGYAVLKVAPRVDVARRLLVAGSNDKNTEDAIMSETIDILTKTLESRVEENVKLKASIDSLSKDKEEKEKKMEDASLNFEKKMKEMEEKNKKMEEELARYKKTSKQMRMKNKFSSHVNSKKGEDPMFAEYTELEMKDKEEEVFEEIQREFEEKNGREMTEEEEEKAMEVVLEKLMKKFETAKMMFNSSSKMKASIPVKEGKSYTPRIQSDSYLGKNKSLSGIDIIDSVLGE